MSSSMQNMKTTTMTWHTSTALIRSFLPMSRKNIITITTKKANNIIIMTKKANIIIMTKKANIIATAMKTANIIITMTKKASTTATAMKRVNTTTIMTRKGSTIATAMKTVNTITITMMKNITARISMAKRAIIMIMTTFMAITTIMNTAIWRMSWRSLTALP